MIMKTDVQSMINSMNRF